MTRGRLFYGWIVVVVTALTLVVSAGVRSAPGVFLVPMLPSFSFDRAALSLAASLGILLFGLTGPFAGALMDRFGPRRTMLAGMGLVGASMVLSARMTSVWELHLLWGMLSGVGTGMASAVLGATVANRWFVARRGLVVGIFGAATSAGQLIFILLLAWLAESIGWRASALALGAVALAVLIPTFLLMRDDPADIGVLPLGAEPPGRDDTGARSREASKGAAEAPASVQGGGSGVTPHLPRSASRRALVPSWLWGDVMRQAVRTPTFWLLAGTFFVCGATSNGLVGVHFIPYAVDCGIPAVTAAGALSLMGMFNFVGTLGSGYLTDRYDPRKLLCIYYGFRGLSLFLLPFTTNPAGLVIFAVLFGLDYIATVPPTTALVADTFGRRNVGTVFGWVFCAHQVGAALAAWLGGVAREALGDYVLTFLVAGGIAVVAGLVALRIERGVPQVQVAPAA